MGLAELARLGIASCCSIGDFGGINSTLCVKSSAGINQRDSIDFNAVTPFYTTIKSSLQCYQESVTPV